MDFMLFMLNIAWKILGLCMGWMLFRYVLKNGSGTFREFLDTVSAMLKAFGHWIRKVCLGYLNKEESSEQTKVEKEAVTAAYNEYLKKRRAECMSFEEFSKKMRDGDTFTLD